MQGGDHPTESRNSGLCTQSFSLYAKCSAPERHEVCSLSAFLSGEKGYGAFSLGGYVAIRTIRKCSTVNNQYVCLIIDRGELVCGRVTTVLNKKKDAVVAIVGNVLPVFVVLPLWKIILQIRSSFVPTCHAGSSGLR